MHNFRSGSGPLCSKSKVVLTHFASDSKVALARFVTIACPNLAKLDEAEPASPKTLAQFSDRLWMAGRVVGCRKVVAPGVLKWPERLGERRGFPKVGLVLVFLSTHVGTVGSLERP